MELQIPLRFRLEPVDRQHPNRVAIVRGPVVMAFDFNYYEAGLRPPGNDAELNRWLTAFSGAPAPFTPPNGPAVFGIKDAQGVTLAPKFRPFYEYAENFPYLMYMETTARLADLW